MTPTNILPFISFFLHVFFWASFSLFLSLAIHVMCSFYCSRSHRSKICLLIMLLLYRTAHTHIDTLIHKFSLNSYCRKVRSIMLDFFYIFFNIASYQKNKKEYVRRIHARKCVCEWVSHHERLRRLLWKGMWRESIKKIHILLHASHFRLKKKYSYT